MTMPVLIANYQKKHTITRLKKVYSILSQAYKLSENDNGPSQDWINNSLDINTENVKKYVQTYWLPYFKYIEECSNLGDCSYDNNTELALVGNNRYTIILSDGTLIAFVPFSWNDEDKVQYWGDEQKFYIDLNGAKKPNLLGKDIFVLSLYNHKVSGVCAERTYSYVNSECSTRKQCCAEKIIRDGWEIKDDYPW